MQSGNLSPQPLSPSRRKQLKTMGIIPFATLGFLSVPQRALALPTCTLAPSQTEGPYWVDEKLNRMDITTGTTRSGVANGRPMTLEITALNNSGQLCGNKTAGGMQIDIWHCDANGDYSDTGATLGQTFLRGYQVTDSSGKASFRTIYPGWYSGRTCHIHFRARAYDAAGKTTYNFTTQLYFDDSFTDQIYAQAPYNTRGTRNTRNSNDGIFRGSASSPELTLSLQGDGSVHAEVALGFSGLPASALYSGFRVSASDTGTASMPDITCDLTVETSHVGNAGEIYVAAQAGNNWYFNNGSSWIKVVDPVTSTFPAFYKGMLSPNHVMRVLNGINTSGLGSVRLYVGYGLDRLDMMENQRIALVRTLNA
jgi:protocatechuate 3,4-dioxygenase beta subunit